MPGVTVRPTRGHTRGHQAITICSGGRQAIYLGDICPTTAHLRTFWTMAYDQFPLEVRQQKPALLKQAIESQQLVLFDHDPIVPAAILEHDERGGVRVAESVALA